MSQSTTADVSGMKASQLPILLDQRTHSLRKSFCDDNLRSTTQRRAGCRFDAGTSPASLHLQNMLDRSNYQQMASNLRLGEGRVLMKR